MIRCLPKGLCSWDYRLSDGDRRAELEFNWSGEQGAITSEAIRFEVCKHGLTSGRWTLQHDGRQVAAAQKTSPFTRTFEVEAPSGAFLLRAQSAMGRSFVAERSGETLARFFPEHAFTRRANIDSVAADLDFITLAFAFWLVALLWRRAANAAN